jgi:hypothetical protein
MQLNLGVRMCALCFHLLFGFAAQEDAILVLCHLTDLRFQGTDGHYKLHTTHVLHWHTDDFPADQHQPRRPEASRSFLI